MGVLNLDPSALNVALTATAAHIQAYREYSTVETIVILSSQDQACCDLFQNQIS